MRASAWIFKRFSQFISQWRPLQSAFYIFDNGSVERQKNQVEHHLHGCMNFCANRGLKCKMYGDSAAKVNSQKFSWTPPGRASACFAKRFSQTVSWWCPLDSAFAAESDVQYFRRKIWITECWAENQPCIIIEKQICVLVSLYPRTTVDHSVRADCSRIFWVFHARMHQIRKSADCPSQPTTVDIRL